MQHKKALLSIFILIQVIFCLVFLSLSAFKLNIILSYEMAFLSALLVVLASYFNYKKIILKRSKFYEKDFKTLPLIFIKKKQKDTKIIHFKALKDDIAFKDKMYIFALFFALFKMVAYGLLVAGFLFLHRQKYLDIFAYLCGISSLLVCVFIFILYLKRYEFNKNY